MHIEFGSDIDSKSNELFINENVNNDWLNDGYYFRSARDCIKYIAKNNKDYNIAFVPILCCESMVIPFNQYGTNCILYPLNSDYTINEDFVLNNIKDKQILLVSNYLGLKTKVNTEKENEFIKKIKDNYDVIIIRDCTQSLEEALYSDKSKDDYTIFSCRKWAGIPDSGILWSNKKLSVSYDKDNFEYFELKKKAMELKAEYLEKKESSIKTEFLSLFKKAEEIIDNDNRIIRMSSYSEDLIRKIDFEKILKKRRDNIKYFEDNLENVDKVKCLSKFTECSGQYFPIYVNKQKELQKYLASKNIYCPVIWPMIEKKLDKEFEFCNDIVSHMLAVPVDQRYMIEELNYIIDAIKEF